MTTSFGYDAVGRRVRKTGLTGTTRYVWDEDDLVMELDGAGTVLREYSYYPGIDQPHSVRIPSDQNRIYYYLPELPGHVAGLTSETHAVANAYEYTPFGESIPVDITTWMNQPLAFGSRERDSESGMDYLRARYYDPDLGRFISEDPIGLDGGINPYLYAENDPTNVTDPLGLCGTLTGDIGGVTFTACKKEPWAYTPGTQGRGYTSAGSREDLGSRILEAARETTSDFQNRGIKYQIPPRIPVTYDCSHFCSLVLKRAGINVPYHTTRDLASSRCYAQVSAGGEIAGDIMWQPGHMGIYAGRTDAQGHPLGYQMGSHGANIAPWGSGGWFGGGAQLTFYRVNPTC